mmetsp:Transcript_10015/g.36621  ORF Transcript_10015/g.36621 Transcript_10015/m.36621 type:complete len:132 (-) Transcript_10015:1681-2076(-)
MADEAASVEYLQGLSKRLDASSGQLRAHKAGEALRTVLQDPPFSEQLSNDCRAANYEVVMRVLLGIRDQDVSGALAGLGEEECDVLMQYLYRGLASGSREVCSAMFKWHEPLVQRAGAGCILRSMTAPAAL